MNTFIHSETGAVTVDWVVLTAALVGLGLATMGVVSSGVENVSDDIESSLTQTPISTSFLSAAEQYLASYDIAACPDGAQGALDYAAAIDETIGGHSGTFYGTNGLPQPYSSLAEYHAIMYQRYQDPSFLGDVDVVDMTPANAQAIEDSGPWEPAELHDMAMIACVKKERGL